MTEIMYTECSVCGCHYSYENTVGVHPCPDCQYHNVTVKEPLTFEQLRYIRRIKGGFP